MTEVNIGLEGILVGETSISDVNGELGELSYRGYPIAELSSRPFVQVVWLLIGRAPSRKVRSHSSFLSIRN